MLLVAGVGCADAQGDTGAAASSLRSGAGRSGGFETHRHGAWPRELPRDLDAGRQAAHSELRVAELSDAELLLIADRLNGAEVEQARAALPKLEQPEVRDFAQQLLVEHQAARDSLLQFSAESQLFAAPSRASFKLAALTSRAVYRLLKAEFPADAAYIGEQVLAHTEASRVFDGLVDAADEPALRDLFSAQRALIAEHLERARALQSARVGAGAPPDAGR